MATAAHTPNCTSESPRAWPMTGKRYRATTLRRNTVARATLMASDRAPMADPTAAMAVPPQMLVPEVRRSEVCRSTCSLRPSQSPRARAEKTTATV
jgi:hypothetical protein